MGHVHSSDVSAGDWVTEEGIPKAHIRAYLLPFRSAGRQKQHLMAGMLRSPIALSHGQRPAPLLPSSLSIYTGHLQPAVHVLF